jgi:hypothetical protein
MLCGGDSMLDLERVRADRAGAELRAVAEVPAASTACQLARRYRRSHLRAAEQAFAACANAMDGQLGRSPDGPVTLDFDLTGVRVYGRNKPGAGVNYHGQLAEQPRQLLARALGYLPDGHGQVAARFDSGFHRTDLLADCRARGVRFSVSVPRSSAMWSALERIDDDAWRPADGLKDAEVAETTYTPSGCKHEPLRLIVRRVAHQADALSDDPRARRKRTIAREQLDLGLARRGRRRLRLQLHPHRPPGVLPDSAQGRAASTRR